MKFMVVLVCLLLQRYWAQGAHWHSRDQLELYFKKIEKISLFKQTSSLVQLLIRWLSLPLLLLVLSLFVKWSLGVFIEFLLNVAVLWYCLSLDSLQEAEDPARYFEGVYERVFAMMFWYILLGVFGAALYYMITEIKERVAVKSASQLPLVEKIQAIMDWLPIRLLGISFALVGHFSSVFSSWLNELTSGLSTSHRQISKWGMEALNGHSKEKSSSQEAKMLVERALLLWLVALALISIGTVIG